MIRLELRESPAAGSGISELCATNFLVQFSHMHELLRQFPNPEVLLALEAEELGAKLLFILRNRQFQRNMFMPSSLIQELWPSLGFPGPYPPYPANRREAIEEVLTEAWAWLEAQGLIVPAADSNGSRGWRILSRRAKKFQSETEFAHYAVARMFPKELLHRKIAHKVWLAFMRGEFDVAVFQAMKTVEVAVRDAAGLGDSVIGVTLMRQAFSPERGCLTDLGAEGGERSARMELFSGAIGCYKNPHSHRDIDLNDPAEAIEIILLANHLLRIVDSRIKAISQQENNPSPDRSSDNRFSTRWLLPAASLSKPNAGTPLRLAKPGKVPKTSVFRMPFTKSAAVDPFGLTRVANPWFLEQEVR
jgi:uncharacterized protein (TIGR02391 family)